jgi:hypothetical protein
MRPIYLILIISSVFCYACGPLTAHSDIAQAQIAVEAARGAEASRYAIYEYRSAQNYLRKAKEEEGFSSFQSAINLAKKAIKYADEARVRSFNAKRLKMTRTLKQKRQTTPSPASSSSQRK